MSLHRIKKISLTIPINQPHTNKGRDLSSLPQPPAEGWNREERPPTHRGMVVVGGRGRVEGKRRARRLKYAQTHATTDSHACSTLGHVTARVDFD